MHWLNGCALPWWVICLLKCGESEVYRDGKVCISILHPPGEDELSGELASERWMPTQTIASIMLSVISMLNDPNLSSPANVEASVMFRDRRSEFNDRCALLVASARSLVPAHVKIPHPETNEQERQRALLKHRAMGEEDFGVESEPLDGSDDMMDSEGGDDFGLDEDEDRVAEDPSDEAKPPRKKKKEAAKEKAAHEEPVSKKSAKAKGNGKKAVPAASERGEGQTKAKGERERAEQVETEEEAFRGKKTKPQRERADQVETEEEGLSDAESASSSMDAKELDNLMQPEAEFKQWKRVWQPLVIWKATSKGWTAVKAQTAKASKGSKNASFSGDLSILTYNVLRHSTAEGAHRATEQLRLLREANAHVVVLNDVSPSFQQQLGEQAAFLGYYAVYAHHLASDAALGSSRADASTPETLVKGATSLVLSKSPILQAQLLALPSRTERHLIRVECAGTASHSLVVVAAHLDDSPRDVKLRVQQLAQLNKATEGFTNTPHVQVYAGDLGLSAGTKEHKVISNAFTDVWTSLHPADPGLTYDPDSNRMLKVLSSSAQPTRRDRILFKSDALSLSPTDAQLLGTSKLSHKYKGAAIWPSDHYALLASFAGFEGNSTSKKASKCVIS